MKTVEFAADMGQPLARAAGALGIGPFWGTEPERLVLWFAILAMLVVVAIYAIGKIRPKPIQKEPKASQMLSKFRDLHSGGVLSDEEFRTIKTNLTTQLKDELNDNGETD
jgi:uncharacterized membrane protein